MIALAFGACAGGASDADRAQARDALVAYGRAYAARDGVAGCRLLTKPMRARYEQRGRSCAAAFARLAGDERGLRLGRARITAEREGALSGIVEFDGRAGPGPGGEVRLVERGNRWLVDQDLLCITPTCEP